MRAAWIILIVLSYINNLLAQQKEPPVNFPSPNAAAFSVFGDIPVNKFTGTPDISIPIYKINEGDISLPISLQYHPSSVQANSHPGWTGLGMSLLSGGVITRSQKGFPDEFKMSTGQEIGFYYNFGTLNTADWSTTARMKVLAQNMTFLNVPADPMADEFSFNFLGYSGTFRLDETGQWKTSGTDNIKVIVDPVEGIVRTADLRLNVRTDMPSQISSGFNYHFNKFKLITPDGTIYEFGGINATEYSVPYRTQRSSYVVGTSWFLTKITSTSGKEIKLTYDPGLVIVTLGRHHGATKYNRPGGGWFSLDPSCSGTSVNLNPKPGSGYLIFPVYLKEITTSFQKVSFTKSISTELKYDNFDLLDDPTDSYDFFEYFNNPLTQIRWFKLDQISIADNQGVLFKTFNFNYSKSLSTRLKLLSLTEEDKDHLQNSKYKFVYNTNSVPAYCIDQVDHWGFYNGYNVQNFNPTTVEEWINLYPNTRAPDEDGQYIRADLLEKIVYPTGGYTTYEYEPHTYAKVVNKERTNLTIFSQNQPGGGARIKRIASFEFDGTLLGSKEYLYVRNYIGQSNTSGLLSSGILGGLTQYYWPGFVGKDLGGSSFTYDLFSSNSLLPSSINSNGSHIGYSEVVEKVSGNGYTKTFFSNYDEDVFGQNHMDEQPVNYIDPSRSVYSPYTSKSIERGLPQLTEIYNESGQKVQSSKILYEATSSEYWRALDLEHFDICSNVTASAQIWFGTAFKNYRYSFLKTKEENTIYEPNQPHSTTQTTFYHYNSNNLVDRITQASSLGIEKKQEVIYPDAIATGVSATDPETKAIEIMAGDAHMLNVPIETISYVNGNVIGSIVNKYQYSLSKVVPSQTYRTQLATPIPSTNYSKSHIEGAGANALFKLDPSCNLRSDIFTYDGNRNLQAHVGEDGVVTTYLWSYKTLFPVAKIINASYQDVVSVLGQNVIDNLLQATPTQTELEQAMLPLRNSTVLKKAQITTYTYSPLKGMTTTTDPNGIKVYYEYDSFGRLLFTKDNNQNVLKKYEYNYQAK